MDKKSRSVEVRKKHGLGKEHMRAEWIIIPMTLLILAGLQSCSPRIVEHYTTVRDTTYISQHVRDSIFERDSIYVLQKQDTVYQYVEKWRTRYLYKTDTLYQSVRDTTVIKETIEVPRARSWWDKTKNYIIYILLGAVLFAYRKQIVKLFVGI